MQSHERREEGENDLGTGQGRAQAGEGHMENGLDIYVYFNFLSFTKTSIFLVTKCWPDHAIRH